MAYTFEDIKSLKRSESYFAENFRNFFEVFDGFYKEEDVKSLYIKKATDEEPLKTYIFFDKKIVIVSKEEIFYTFDEFRYEKVSKIIKTHKDSFREVELNLVFDNSRVLNFNSLNDALYGDYELYGDSLKELFKQL